MSQQVVPLTLIKGDDIGGQETDYRDALPVNMYAVLKPIFGKDGYMIQAPGLTTYATGIGSDRRGIWNERDLQHYRVSGNKLVSVDDAGVVTELGTVSGADIASMPYSFNTQAIIADGKMWLYDSTNGFREVTDPDLGAPIDGVWVDGYYFLTDGENLYHTDISDESSIDPLKFATAEFMPDASLGVAKTQDNKVMVFGRYTTEYFINTASENFAFSRAATRAIKIGIVGTHCKTEVAGKHYILGSRKEEAVSVHALGVGSATKVSTREVDKIIGEYTETELAGAWLDAYNEDGYSFITVNMPRHTLLFNETVASKIGIEQAWSILKTDTLSASPWRGAFAVFDPRRSQWLFGDKNDLSIGFLDAESALTYGEQTEWELYTPFVYLEDLSIDELEVETIPGHTASDDATVFISMTYDGVSYSKEWVQDYGAPNEYGKRFIAYRLGYVAHWVGFKLRGISSSRMAFSKGSLKVG